MSQTVKGLIITAALLGLIAAGSAAGKLQRKEALMTQLTGLGVPAAQIPLLGLLEIAGALGLLIGIWVPGLGVAAAFGLVLYFAGAVGAHLRHHDGPKEFAPALVIFILAVVTLLLELHR